MSPSDQPPLNLLSSATSKEIMKIDRAVQLEILQKLAEAYPIGIQPLAPNIESTDDEMKVMTNAMYLAEHKLVQHGYKHRGFVGVAPEDAWTEVTETRITAAGIDFLLEDGGLSAILGVVTVKLDASTIKALLYKHIDEAKDVTHEQRSLAKNLLKSAGDQTLRKLVDSLIEQGLKAAPSTSQLIGMLQGLLA